MSSYPRCKTCKHWNSQYRTDGNGECEYIYYGMMTGPSPDKAAIEASGVTDESTITVITAPDFGCIAHEPNATGPARGEGDE